MKYTIDTICKLVHGELLAATNENSQEQVIEHLVPDSRKVVTPSNSLFFCIQTSHRDGHEFIRDLYDKGVKNFIVSRKIDTSLFPGARFVFVADTIEAIQKLSATHRKQFNIPVIGITGSNGKTIVKEWLFQLLNEDYNLVRSPRSYNSQIGVPLSVWQMKETHSLAIFEAGISKTGEMMKLADIISPTIGVLTNIGQAHSEGFASQEEKLREKLLLFRNAGTLIFNKDLLQSLSVKNITEITGENTGIFDWSLSSKDAKVYISGINREKELTEITAESEGRVFRFKIPFADEASVENAITCFCVLLFLGMDKGLIVERMACLQAVNMRLEMKKGINNCQVINDSYSADLSSLQIALNFLQQQTTGVSRTVILSDFLQTGMKEVELYNAIGHLLRQHSVQRVIGIGDKISIYLPEGLKGADIHEEYFPSTENFTGHFRFSRFRDETILIKGARKFEFERITQLLEQKLHQTVLEINLTALVHNLKQHRLLLEPGTRIMAMVKAFSYGSGGAEIASILQYHKADYLGVAYADEGIELRKSGISLPIMVMNPEDEGFESLAEYNLEPELYSFRVLRQFEKFVKNEGLQEYPVHIEIETGMHRLGFDPAEMEELGKYLAASSYLKVRTVFSHLVASEDASQNEFSLHQFAVFKNAASVLQTYLQYPFLKHIANSAAIARFSQMQMDMVRAGIGLYGIQTATTSMINLLPVTTLKSTVSQVKNLKKGESVSYGRDAVVKRDTVIATVRIGYADGYPRRLGHGVGQMFVKGAMAKVIGTVCMDMTMIDITDISGVEEGEEVIIFGKELPVQKLAEQAQTIPYEIMTGISQRVKRVYFEE